MAASCQSPLGGTEAGDTSNIEKTPHTSGSESIGPGSSAVRPESDHQILRRYIQTPFHPKSCAATWGRASSNDLVQSPTPRSEEHGDLARDPAPVEVKGVKETLRTSPGPDCAASKGKAW